MANFEALTDKQIYNLALLDWSDILGKLWAAFGKPLNTDQFEVYREALSDVPLGILEHVVDETIKKHTYNSVPTLAEVLETLEKFYPYHQGEEKIYVHTTPNRDAAERVRRQAPYLFPTEMIQ